jgi:hypothetical protein
MHNLKKLLEDALEQTIGTQHLVEMRKILWDQIIYVIDQFRLHLEIHQYCEKKIPQAERIIEFMNSLFDQVLKDSRVKDRFEAVSNVKNVIDPKRI